MFGNASFGEFCFSDFSVYIIYSRATRGRTKVVAIVDQTTGRALIIEKQKHYASTTVSTTIEDNVGSIKNIDAPQYFGRTKVSIIKNISTSINALNNNPKAIKPNN
jgi:hypothetical protein